MCSHCGAAPDPRPSLLHVSGLQPLPAAAMEAEIRATAPNGGVWVFDVEAKFQVA